MTPLDCVELFNSLEKEFPDEMKDYSLSRFFPENNRRLSLNDSRQYEEALKLKLVKLHKDYPQKINKILDEYKIEVDAEEPNLYCLFKEIVCIIRLH